MGPGLSRHVRLWPLGVIHRPSPCTGFGLVFAAEQAGETRILAQRIEVVGYPQERPQLDPIRDALSELDEHPEGTVRHPHACKVMRLGQEDLGSALRLSLERPRILCGGGPALPGRGEESGIAEPHPHDHRIPGITGCRTQHQPVGLLGAIEQERVLTVEVGARREIQVVQRPRGLGAQLKARAARALALGAQEVLRLLGFEARLVHEGSATGKGDVAREGGLVELAHAGHEQIGGLAVATRVDGLEGPLVACAALEAGFEATESTSEPDFHRLPREHRLSRQRHDRAGPEAPEPENQPEHAHIVIIDSGVSEGHCCLSSLTPSASHPSMPLMYRSLLVISVVILAGSGCRSLGGAQRSKRAGTDAPSHPLKIHSLSDTTGVTALAAVDNALWVGTRRGLIRWDFTGPTSTMVQRKDGLPSDMVSAVAPDYTGGLWVMTSSGLARFSKGAWSTAPALPVGAFVTGLVQANDGSLWAGGPEGLARFRNGRWERYLGTTSVTALAAVGPDLWVGTSDHGVVRVNGDRVFVYGADQGCEIDVVRGLASGPLGLVVIGKDLEEHERIAIHDGKRFWTYRVEAPARTVLEWVRHIGGENLFGSGSQVYTLSRVTTLTNLVSSSLAPFKLVPMSSRPRRRPAPSGAATGELPETEPVGAPTKGTSRATHGTASQDKGGKGGKGRGDDEAAPPLSDAPRWEVLRWGPQLPDAVTAVGPDGPTLYVGTRFLGAARIEPNLATHFRTGDLSRNAVSLNVACVKPQDCYVATGGAAAWHYDGRSFEPADIDPEVGSRVLAVVEVPPAQVLAIHRGASDRVLRISTVAEGRWTPIAVQEVQVPEGVPDITFATVAPNRHLWLGLNYVDRVGDRVDYGAAEVSLDLGKVTYHRRFTSSKTAGQGLSIPNDVVAVYFRNVKDFWFGSHSGAAHVTGTQVRLYTENDAGLESEYIRDILEGPDGNMWVATSRGVGTFDGKRWNFPPEGDVLHLRTTALARDRRNIVFIGTERGLFAKTGADIERIDVTRGLLDNHVHRLAIDQTDRVWLLTEKGLSTVER